MPVTIDLLKNISNANKNVANSQFNLDAMRNIQNNSKVSISLNNLRALDKTPKTKKASYNKEDGFLYNAGKVGTQLMGTALDIQDTAVRGVIGFGEGIVDAGAKVIGAFLNENGKNNINKFTQVNLADEFVDNVANVINPSRFLLDKAAQYYNPFEERSIDDINISDTSFINNLGQQGQNIIRGTVQGMTQLAMLGGISKLGTSLSTSATAGKVSSGIMAANDVGKLSTGLMTGAQALSHAKKVGQAAALIGISLSSAGSSMVEATMEGADYNESLLYGTLSGVTEGLIEQASGFIGDVLPFQNIAKQGLKGIVKNSVGEGMEEVASDVINPFLKLIYKGKLEMPEISELATSFTVGSLSSLIGGGMLALNNSRLETKNKKLQPDVDAMNDKIAIIEQLSNIDMSQLDETDKSIVQKELTNKTKLLKLDLQTFANKQREIDTVQNYEVKPTRNLDRFIKERGTNYSNAFIRTLKEGNLNTVTHSDKEALATLKDMDKLSYNDLKTQANMYIGMYQEGKRMNKSDIAKAYYTMDKLANEYADIDTSANLMQSISLLLTESGRNVQAAKLLNYLSPRGKLDFYNKKVEKTNNLDKKNNRKLNKNIVADRYKKHYAKDLKIVHNQSINNVLRTSDINISSDTTNALLDKFNTDIKTVSKEKLNELINDVSTILNSDIKDANIRKSIAKKIVERVIESDIRLSDKYDNSHVLIPENLIEKAINAKNTETRDKVFKEVEKTIDQQYNATLWEKMEAFRMFNMLFNIKTHARNFIGNYVMNGVVRVKDAVKATLETIANVEEGKRTTTLKKVSPQMKQYTNEIITLEYFSDNKYELDGKKVFTSKVMAPIEMAMKFNALALEKADIIACNSMFKYTFGKWATANNYDVELLKSNDDIRKQGEDYAIEESLKATFKEHSYLAEQLNIIQRKNVITRVLVGGAIPFKRTPINIVKIGVRYSPVGLAKTLTYNMIQLKKHKINQNQFIDNISQGIVGSAVCSLGFMLAKLGILGLGDDDNYEYDKAIGEQKYALRIGDFSYTLDWLSPSAIPLFTGVSLYDSFSNESESNLNAIYNTIIHMADPITEMSMMQSLNSILTQYKTDGVGGTLGAIVSKTGENYVSTFVPTLGSQIAKVIDPYTRTSVATKNNTFGSKNVQKYINTLMAKVPGLSMLLEPYVDVWGNEVKNYNGFASSIGNAFEQTVSPGWWSNSTLNTSIVDKEILRLYTKTGNNSVVPKLANSYYSVDGVRYDMTSKEFTNFKKEVGSNSYKTLEKVFSSSWYNKLSEEEREIIITKVYSDSKDYAKEVGRFNSTIKKSFQFHELEELYLEMYLIKGDDNMSKKEKTYRFVNSLTLPKNKKNILLDFMGY